jgi:hypothetical protein
MISNLFSKFLDVFRIVRTVMDPVLGCHTCSSASGVGAFIRLNEIGCMKSVTISAGACQNSAQVALPSLHLVVDFFCEVCAAVVVIILRVIVTLRLHIWVLCKADDIWVFLNMLPKCSALAGGPNSMLVQDWRDALHIFAAAFAFVICLSNTIA